MADDELDSLYRIRPDAFTAERTRLAGAARQRGDTAAAKKISAARKPTMSAWVVNRLALERKDTTQRLGDLGDRLRAAHAAMDGELIRDLSAEQHRLIEQLTRGAFEAADMKTPSSAARDDVAGTLQAAIADPHVLARLGRLARPEQWSGFGAFADAAPESAPARKPARREKLNAALRAAERAKGEAEDTLSKRQAERDEAEQRRDEALATLREAKRELSAAEDRYAEAQEADRAAAELVKEAKAQLKRA